MASRRILGNGDSCLIAPGQHLNYECVANWSVIASVIASVAVGACVRSGLTRNGAVVVYRTMGAVL